MSYLYPSSPRARLILWLIFLLPSCKGGSSPASPDALDARVAPDSLMAAADVPVADGWVSSRDSKSTTMEALPSVDSRADNAGDAGTPSVGVDASSPTDATLPNLSNGCYSTQPLKTGELTLTGNDGKHAAVRTYVVQVPPTANRQTPLALTLLYHGAGGTPEASKGFGLQSVPSAAASSIFVFPAGIAYQTYGVGWNDSCGGYDMTFFDHIVSSLEDSYCIDKSRVFAGGFSWGCDHVTALACCRGDVIRAVAAGSCSDEFGDASNYKTYSNLPCGAKKYPAIRFTHDSGPKGDGPYSAVQFASTSALFRSFQGCSNPTLPAPTTGCASYQNCANSVVECFYAGLGHSLPGDWASASWSFFSAAGP